MHVYTHTPLNNAVYSTHHLHSFFLVVSLFEARAYVALAGPELAVYLRMTLNSCWECSSMLS